MRESRVQGPVTMYYPDGPGQRRRQPIGTIGLPEAGGEAIPDRGQLR